MYSQFRDNTGRRSPKRYTEPTEADALYQQGLEQGLDKKTAAKQAQAATGLSLITGQRMKTRGYGWQKPSKTQVT